MTFQLKKCKKNNKNNKMNSKMYKKNINDNELSKKC